MQNNYALRLRFLKLLLFIFLALALPAKALAQIYQHNFGTTAITAYPYTVAPTVINANLNTSSWQNSVGAWTSNTGASGQAIQLTTPSGTSTLTLTFNVANGYAANITSYSFWSRRSNSGPSNWSLAINGTTVGNGTVTTGGAALATTPVSTPITGLSGTVTVTLTVSNANGGNIRLDDFTLNGSVVSTCTSGVINSFSPASGPQNTQVTITGSGFTGATSVTFDGIAATYTVISDTIIKAFVPAGVTNGIINVTASGCTGVSPTNFSLLQTSCNALGTEIFISELYDQDPNSGGMIELYNPTNATITFNSQYSLLRYGNVGDTTPTYTLVLPGSIAAHSTYLINCGPPLQTQCVTPSSSVTLGVGFNDDDKIELLKNSIVIDRVYTDTAPITSPGFTMIRKPYVTGPTSTYNSNEWNITDNPAFNGTINNYCANLGMHSMNPVTPPAITQPASQTVCENGTTSFTTSATGTGFTYQWKMLNATGSWVNITNGGNYSGAITPTLTVTNVPASFDGNQYYCVITSSECDILTNAALLTVGGTLATPQATVTDATCATPGQAVVTSPLGTGFTYTIDGINYQASVTFANLSAGSYSIIAKDAGGCTSAAFDFTVQPGTGAPAAPVFGTPTQPTCTTGTGSITITAPTGAGITYSVDGVNYQTSTTFTLAPGTYSVTAKNADGCVSNVTPLTINAAPGAPAAPVFGTPTQPTCTTGTGSITITSPTGTGITYSADGVNYQTSTTFTLAPGTYSVTAKNADGCVSNATPLTINAAPGAPAAPVFGTPTQPTCTTGTGSITITAPTGTGITYSVDGVNYQTSTTFTLAPGTYSVTAKNADGCVSNATPLTINAAPGAPAAPVFGTPTQPTCTTGTGSITITSPTGTGITYSVDGVNYQSGTTFSLAPGTYSVTAKNAAGCVSNATPLTINAAPAGPAVATVVPTQPDCTTSTGSITITAPTGAGYQYRLNNGPYQTATTFTGLVPGSYTVTVQNADGCTSVTGPVVINNSTPTFAPPTLDVQQPDCDTTLGNITVVSPLGTGYTYSIDGANYSNVLNFPNLTPGTYSITVKNSNGCVSLAAVQLINSQPSTPTAPGATVTQQPDCSQPTGTITVTPPTGTGYMYSINGINYQASNVFSGLNAGTYSITVRNSAGCVSPAVSRTINAAPAGPMAPSVTATNPADCSQSTGTLTVLAPLGAGLSYSIDGVNYQTGTVFSNLPAGTYPVTTKNAAGCVSVANVKVIDGTFGAPAAPTLSAIQPDCTHPLGSITVTSPTGTGLTYSINGGSSYQNGTTFANLEPGNYSIQVRNAAGCVSAISTQAIVASPLAPAKPIVTTVDPDCTTSTGSLTITSPTGTGITYSINGAAYNAATNYTNLNPGIYHIIAQNAAGCISLTATVTIKQAPAIPAVPLVTVTQPTCAVPSGTITVTGPLGTGYTYSRDGGTTYQTSPVFSGLGGGTYYITVSNAGGCTAVSAAILVSSPPAPAPAPGTISGGNTVCMGDTLALTESEIGGVWSSSNTAIAIVDTNGVVTPVSAGTVQIIYTVGTQCTATAQQTVTIYSLPQPVLKDTWLCEDPATGVITDSKTLDSGLSAADYTFVWTKNGTTLPDTSAAITVTETGNYTVTATNILSGCSNSATATVGLSSIALATVQVGTDFSNSQIITVTVTGGSGDYEYSLSGMPYQSEPVFSGITHGEYTIRVRDKQGCGFIELTVFALNYPHFFSPNGDGTYDTWNIKDLKDQHDAVIYIFDRYGKIITSVFPAGKGWDGTLNGYPLPATDYWFTLFYTTSSGDRKEFKAHFSLVR